MSNFVYSTLIVIWSLTPLMVITFVEVPQKKEMMKSVTGQNATLFCKFRNTVPRNLESNRYGWGLKGKQKSRGKVSNKFCLCNPLQDHGIKAGHSYYQIPLDSDILIYCLLDDPLPREFGWTRKGKKIPNDNRHLTELRLGGMLVQTIRRIDESDMGAYRCQYQNETASGYSEINITRIRVKRAIESTQLPQVMNIPRGDPEENLIIGLIKDFAKMQNTSRITACLPLPKTAGEPIKWGIMTFPFPKNVGNNTVCKQEMRVLQVKQKQYIKQQWKLPGRREDCYKLLNHQFVQSNSMFSFGDVGWCTYDVVKEIIAPQERKEWVCREKDEVNTKWDSVWSTSILQKFQYGGDTPWCFRWTGKQSVTNDLALLATNKVSRDIIESVSWWNCSKTFDCDTDPKQITIPPVRIALITGCSC
ncbi:uncharacterized protein LOC128850785 isoform X6 [Cuculus canorus]|uniref:uncharacterized protein LOC128850785 isoform X6 n=1 Tax=Cuculus canorus TaxID=55661 RepID=UPI0023AA5465|nr:uncharacterized protein LOC128850785 isoform X6 [Cuculus canorus]XP_053911769.1 uncharacterized protein LOC128850785 isoform X6 [Cuculus canorus]XP_053911770.1 uncharacterized protein LOC128850785 isoform X6 [Cuculus canorus]XP_053911771.1 uncharacterized protein LOC128850785 isoform X6 [Cuculus canorus]